MPVGPYETFAACIAAQTAKGHPPLSARRICGAIEKHVDEDLALALTDILTFGEAELRAAQDLAVRSARTQLERGLARGWRKEGLHFARLYIASEAPAPAPLREAGFGERWGRLLDQAEDAVLAEMKRVIRDADGSGLAAGWRRAVGRLSVTVGSFDMDHPRAVAFMEQHGAELVGRINETTRDRLRDLLADAVDQGWSVPETARQIRRTFYGFGDRRYGPATGNTTRAAVVAATETAAAYSEGTLHAAGELEQAGLPMEKAWLPAPTTDDICCDNADAGYIPLGEPFPGQVQRPPQHPQCRCGLLTRVSPAGIG